MKLSQGEDIKIVELDGTERTVVSSTGLVNVASGVQIVSTTTATITASGVTVLEGIAARAYSLVAAPIPGVMKTIINKSSTAAVTVDLGVGIAYSTATATDAPHIITFTTQADPSAITLVGLTTALWGVISNLGGATYSS